VKTSSKVNCRDRLSAQHGTSSTPQVNKQPASTSGECAPCHTPHQQHQQLQSL
jgi:hypothetical protein